ncbi:MAG: ribosomal-protein-alanine N-acetyltransferase [Acholeplasmatales bacterium]|nr:MAG: ribosomal-protein-alanine N-acetyltransferase [Acholeplasmatales bacterium]
MLNPEVRLRKASMADVSYIETMEQTVFGKTFGKKMLTEEILYNPMAYYRVLEVDGRRVGYCSLWITIPHAEIVQIVLEPAYRGAGYGRLMMTALLALCTEHAVEAVTLEVRVSNTAAIGFYERLGFVRASVRKQYYDNGEDALLMLRQLAPSSEEGGTV